MMPSPIYGDPAPGLAVGAGLALGVTLAEVSDANDPKGMGRIKVRFLVESAAGGGDDQSSWVQMMSPFAGDGHGAFFLPKVGDLAVVAFGNGDPSKPVVLGFLWNGALKPPVEQALQMEVRAITTVQGKTLTFDDSKNGRITIADEKQNRITLDTANNAIAIESQGNLTLTAKGTITITAAKVTIQNTEETATVKLDDGGVEIEGAGSIKLSADMIDLN
jgi:uncharacterized protein involved in type VI secretion and phage assembly